MIKRDKHGIICQHDPNVLGYMDGGDSASRTGLLALCGSAIDAGLLAEFYDLNAGLVRHPYQEQWDDVTKTSRDQLVMWASGRSKAVVAAQQRYNFFVNKDFLAPDVRGHLRRCAGLKPTLLQQGWLTLSIWWQSRRPDEECNQLLSMCIVAGPGPLRLFNRLVPNWRQNVMEYWGGYPFRDQKEIGKLLIERAEGILNEHS